MAKPILGSGEYLYEPLRKDQPLVFGLPMELVQVILRELPWKDTVKCSLINRAMYQITSDSNRYHANIAQGIYVSHRIKFGKRSDRDGSFPVGYTNERDARGFSASAFSAIRDGKFFVGFENGAIKLWDLKMSGFSKEIRKEFSPCWEKICSCAFEEGELFVGFEKGKIEIWNVEEGKCVESFTGHENAVTGDQEAVCSLGLAMGKLISGDDNGTIKIWDRKTLKCLATLEGHTLSSCPFTVACGKLISGSFRGKILIYDLVNGVGLEPLQGEESWVTFLKFTAGNLLVGHSVRTIEIWDMEKRECQVQIPGTDANFKGIESLVFSDGELFSLDGAGSVRIWDVEKRCCRNVFEINNPGAKSIDLIDGKLVVLSSDGLKTYDFKATDDEVHKDIRSLDKYDYDAKKEADLRFSRMRYTASGQKNLSYEKQ